MKMHKMMKIFKMNMSKIVIYIPLLILLLFMNIHDIFIIMEVFFSLNSFIHCIIIFEASILMIGYS